MDGVDFRTTDGGRWGAGTGAGIGGNLTPVQLDLDLWTLLTRIQALETSPPTAVSVVSNTIIGTQWTMNMSDGSHLGPYTLPLATFQFKGNWVNSMHYYELDIVSAPHFGLYLVRIAHDTPAGPATFDPTAQDGLGHNLYLPLWEADEAIYDLAWFYPGRPGIGIEDTYAIAGHEFIRAVTIEVDLDGSDASLKLAPAADLSFDIQLNDVTIGSLDFAAGVATGTFTVAASHDVVPGDVITLMKPAAIDTDARELKVTLKFVRVFE